LQAGVHVTNSSGEGIAGLHLGDSKSAVADSSTLARNASDFAANQRWAIVLFCLRRV
jgi:hypothetical protein